MTRDELELMWDLKRVCEQVPEFVLEFAGGEMSTETEITFAHRLIDVAEQLMQHAQTKERLVLEGQAGTVIDGAPTQLVVDAGYARIDNEPSGPPPGNESDSGETREPPPPHHEPE